MKPPQEFLPNRFRQFFHLLAAYGIAMLFVWQVMSGFSQFQWNLTAPLLDPNRTTDAKLYDAWGTFYDVIQFIQTQTPENAIILVDSHYIYGNLMLYFLYPRQLLFGGEMVFRTHPEIGYILITDDYPSFPVTGESIMLDDKHGLLRNMRK